MTALEQNFGQNILVTPVVCMTDIKKNVWEGELQKIICSKAC